MSELDADRLMQISIHEAGHAVAYFVLGRPIRRAVARDDEHEVLPVAGTSAGFFEDAVAAASAWSAEKYYYRLGPDAENEIATAWFNLGQSADYDAIEQYLIHLDDVALQDIEDAADDLIARNWRLVETVAEALRAEGDFGQQHLVEIAASLSASLGQDRALYVQDKWSRHRE